MYDLKSCGFFNAFNGRFARIAAERSPEQETSSPAEAVNRQGIDSSCCVRSVPSLEDPRGPVFF
jgi:hypothetical protein